MTRFDLHIHTALSACAENEMSPLQIISHASAAGLTMIGITDHNASANVETTQRIGRKLGVNVIPGIEVTTREDIHLLAYFESLEGMNLFQKLIDSFLPGEKNIPNLFGYQLIYDEHDEIVDMDEQLRNIGISLGMEDAIREIKNLDGYVIPAHLFRQKFSIFSQLGFVRSDFEFDAVEIQYRMWLQKNFKINDYAEGFPAITGSDSHFLDSVGKIYNEIPESADNIKELLNLLKK